MAEVVNFNLKPVSINPVVDNASDTSFLLEVRDPNEEKFDLTGYTAKMELRPYPKSEVVYDSLTTENGRLEIIDSDVAIYFPAKVTANYSFPKACYDLIIQFEGKQWRIAEGLIVFRKEVTNGW